MLNKRGQIRKSSPYNFFMKDRKGQVTIFIIIAVIIVSIIALFFLLRGDIVPGVGGKAETNPNIFLSSCLEEKIK